MSGTARVLLDTARRSLAAQGNPTAALDARLLLQEAAGISRETLIVEPDHAVTGEAATRFAAFMARRLAGEPVSRILGYREFYGRRFTITAATLDPRPDTETLIEAALSWLPEAEPRRIIDLGTGSGAIGVTLLAERPRLSAVMTDISADALAIARANATEHGVDTRASFLNGSWFAGAQGAFDLILSNPPYIPRAILRTLAPEVRKFDPEAALDGGEDGLDPYREIARQGPEFLAPGGRAIVEIGSDQAIEIEDVFSRAGWHPEARWKDLAGHVRCLGFAQGGL